MSRRLFASFLVADVLLVLSLLGCERPAEDEERETSIIAVEPLAYDFDWPEDAGARAGLVAPERVRVQTELETNLSCVSVPWFVLITRDAVTRTVTLGGRALDDPPQSFEFPVLCIERTYSCVGGRFKLTDQRSFAIGTEGFAQCMKGTP